LLPIGYDSINGFVIASLWLVGYDVSEDVSCGVEFILKIPVSENGVCKASEILVEHVKVGPNGI
jgi:hypothetical protein